MAFERRMQIDAQPTTVPPQLNKVITTISKTVTDFTKWAKKQFDFGKVLGQYWTKFKQIFKFDALSDLIGSLKKNMSALFDSVKEGFNGSKLGLADFKKWFGNQFKSIGKTIGKQLAVDMRNVANEFTSWFRQNKSQLTNSLNGIARQIGHLMSSFAEGLVGIFKVGKSMFDWFGQLPTGVKGATYAVLAMWAVLKAGPIGAIISMVTLAGDLIKDYNNYKTNKQNGAVHGDTNYIDVALSGIWDIIDNEQLSFGDKLYEASSTLFSGIAGHLSTWLTDNGASVIETAQQIVDWLKTSIQNAANFISGANANSAQAIAFRNSISDFVSDLIKFVFSSANDLAGTIVDALIGILTNQGVGDATSWQSSFAGKGNKMLGSVATGFMLALSGVSPAISIFAALMSLILNKPKDQNGQQIDWTAQMLAEQIEAFALKFINGIVGILSKVDDFAGVIIDSIATLLSGLFDQDVILLAIQAQDADPQNAATKLHQYYENMLKAIIGGLAAFIISGKNIVWTIIGGIIGAFSDAFVNAFEQAKVDGSIDVNLLAQKFLDNAGETLKGFGILESSIIDIFTDVLSKIDGFKTVAIDWVLSWFNINQSTTSAAQLTQFRDGLQTMLTFTLSTVFSGGNVLSGVFTTFFTTAVTGFLEAKDAIVYTAEQAIAAGNSQLQGKTKQLKDYTTEDWTEIFGFTADKINRMAQNVIFIFTAIINYIRQQWDKPGGLGQKLDKLWNGQNGTDGLKSKLQPLFDVIKNGIFGGLIGACQAAYPLVKRIVFLVEDAMWNNETIAKALRFFGMEAPTQVETNGDGSLTVSTAGQGSVTIDSETANAMSELIGSMSTQNGQLVVGRFGSNADLNAAIQSGDTAQVQRVASVMQEASGFGLGISGQQAYDRAGYYMNAQDWGGANASMQDLVTLALMNGAEYDASGLDSAEKISGIVEWLLYNGLVTDQQAAQEAMVYMVDAGWFEDETNRQLGSIVFSIDINVNSITLPEGYEIAGEGGAKSEGGRIDSPKRHLLGQDGPQYVIPITKTTRSIALIQQMVTEMGGKAKDALSAALGFSSEEGTIGGSIVAGGSIAGVTESSLSYTKNISNPITINVMSSGADARAIGQTVFSTAQSRLLNAIQGAVG